MVIVDVKSIMICHHPDGVFNTPLGHFDRHILFDSTLALIIHYRIENGA